MLNILDQDDIKMSVNTRADRMMQEIKARFELPWQDAALTASAAQQAAQFDPQAARKIREIMGGVDDGKS